MVELDDEQLPDDCADTVFVRVDNLAPQAVHLKVETHNPAGSIKYKTALSLISAARKDGLLSERSTLIESTSGNLGVALSVVCARLGIPLVCVIDPNISAQNRKTMEALGCSLVSVHRRDTNGGYLGTRISYIRRRIERDPTIAWLNQYRNPANPAAHYRWTARAIHSAFPDITRLYIGAGTTGTLMGCARYFRDHRPNVTVVGVDTVGSITFGGTAGPRHIPGLGTSNRPEILDQTLPFEVRHVDERDAVAMCRWLARTHGYLAGGSTGSVLAALRADSDRIASGDVVVAISPDGGERYLDTVYDDNWVKERYGPMTLTGDERFIFEDGVPS